MPKEKYISELRPALLCGADVQFRHHDPNWNVLRDNTGVNISDQNTQYSELTGYYWIWKNEQVDVIGIEHYRRHFIQHTAQIINFVHTEDLLNEFDICNILQSVDFIIPVHQTLANTSVYDLYVICFHEQAQEIVKYMRNYFISKNLVNYVEALYQYMSLNILCRGNMLITTKTQFNSYCSAMFDMIDYLKQNMTVKENSRVWGYVAELFPMIYLTANNLTYSEVDVAVDDTDWQTKEEKVYTTQNQKIEPFEKDPKEQIKFFKQL